MITATSTKGHFKTRLTDGQHTLCADIPVSSGGTGQDMRPGDIWASGLAACLNITTQTALQVTDLQSFLFIYAYNKNALYPLTASYTSALLLTSYGACMLSTATPLSITSIP